MSYIFFKLCKCCKKSRIIFKNGLCEKCQITKRHFNLMNDLQKKENQNKIEDYIK
jgi:hypothetical protein